MVVHEPASSRGIGSPASMEQALISALAEELSNQNKEIAAKIRAELPSYARLPLSEHEKAVEEVTRIFVENILAGVLPTAEQVQSVRRAARRRAYHGVSVYDVLASFHISTREIWKFLERSTFSEGAALIGFVEPLMRWTEVMSEAVVDAFLTDSDTRSGREAELRDRLFAQLDDSLAAEQTIEIARELAFDVAGNFQAFCSPRDFWAQDQIDRFQRSTRQFHGVLHAARRGDLLVVLTQDATESQVLSHLMQAGGGDNSHWRGTCPSRA
jgi:hypothetical protein